MRTTHPNGKLDLFMVAGTEYLGSIDVTDITIGRHGGDSLYIQNDEWDAFAKLIKKMDKYIKKARGD